MVSIGGGICAYKRFLYGPRITSHSEVFFVQLEDCKAMTRATLRKRGRPAFRPTPKLRYSVSIRAAAGITHEDIAGALGIDSETLRKYFSHELSLGAKERRQEIIECMFRTAKKGSVPAQKAYIVLCDKGADGLVTPHPALKKEREPKPEKIGKKDQQQADAVVADVGTDWHDLLKSNARPQ